MEDGSTLNVVHADSGTQFWVHRHRLYRGLCELAASPAVAGSSSRKYTILRRTLEKRLLCGITKLVHSLELHAESLPTPPVADCSSQQDLVWEHRLIASLCPEI